MKLIWYTVLIRAIPETLGVVVLTLALTKEKNTVKNIAITSILCGLVAFTMKMLPVKFGIHTLIIVIIHTFIMNMVLKIKIQKAFKGILLSMMLLMISELVTITFIEYVLKLNPNDVYSSAIGTLTAGLPSVLTLYLLAFVIYKLNRKCKTYGKKEVTDHVDK